MALSDKDKEFLRAERDRRERKLSGEDEITKVQNQPEVIAQLKRADTLQQYLQEWIVPGPQCGCRLSKYKQLNTAVGRTCSDITSVQAINEQSDTQEHSSIQFVRIYDRGVRNHDSASCAGQTEVDGFSQLMDEIPRTSREPQWLANKICGKEFAHSTLGSPSASPRRKAARRAELFPGDGIKVISNFSRWLLELVNERVIYDRKPILQPESCAWIRWRAQVWVFDGICDYLSGGFNAGYSCAE
jgi:hypothetical protein